MRIGINARFLLKDKLEGIGVFTYQIVRRMVLTHPEIQFVFFFDRKFDQSFLFASNIIPVVVPPPARHPLLWSIWFEITLPFYLKRYRVDHFFSPDGYLSLRSDISQSVVIHDLAFEHFPEHVPFSVANFYKKHTPLYCKKASKIFAVSEFTKKDVINRYHVNENKVDVVYNGFLPRNLSSDICPQLPDLYFLYVGSLHPRKNISNLLKAFDLFRDRSSMPLKLVIVGREAWQNNQMKKDFEALKFKSEVIFAGRLSDDDVQVAYKNALALVYVSFFEGFGLPIIEAQSARTAVITSCTSAMPEVAGEGALLVNPNDPESIATGMESLSLSQTLREKYIAKGVLNIERFNWQRSAEKIIGSISEMI